MGQNVKVKIESSLWNSVFEVAYLSLGRFYSGLIIYVALRAVGPWNTHKQWGEQLWVHNALCVLQNKLQHMTSDCLLLTVNLSASQKKQRSTCEICYLIFYSWWVSTKNFNTTDKISHFQMACHRENHFNCQIEKSQMLKDIWNPSLASKLATILLIGRVPQCTTHVISYTSSKYLATKPKINGVILPSVQADWGSLKFTPNCAQNKFQWASACTDRSVIPLTFYW